MLTTELHDVRVQSEISEKARRAAEAEVRAASERISQLTTANSTLSVSHKKLTTEYEQIRVNRLTCLLLVRCDFYSTEVRRPFDCLSYITRSQ